VLFASNGRVLDQEQFSGPIDLKGSAYDRMEANWDQLLKLRDGEPRIQPYDPQIYGTLEHVLRGEGLDSQADEVYRFGREVEGAGLSISSRIGYFVWGKLLGYGTGYRAWIISLAVVLLGGIYFRFAPKEGKLDHLGEAMDRSLRQFLPLDLPGPKWEPSQHSTAAAILKICGWFLVPILVLTVIEFVRRTPK
jgi:hypothetical protein